VSRLPSLRGKDVIRALERAGFEAKRISGSHYRLRHKSDPKRQTMVPLHASHDLPRGTLRDIIDQAGMAVHEFLHYLSRLRCTCPAPGRIKCVLSSNLNYRGAIAPRRPFMRCASGHEGSALKRPPKA
jgi:predicted RNA binding protein YcfA (HicA-like mRNA interferase family)